ncbi:MAG TPA: hypothetical protein VL337_07945 [Acidimicrobiales bacterium]|nr:hypothetical protein [Acidimicrobiales bacterium]
MRSATVRRLALVAVLVVMVPAWGRSGPAPGSVRAATSVLVRAAKAGTLSAHDAASPAATMRRQAGGALGVSGARPDHRRAPAALALVALLALAQNPAWSRTRAGQRPPSSLVRRRYAIVLRAPPLPSCN